MVYMLQRKCYRYVKITTGITSFEGSASSIAEEYRALPEKETVGTDIEYQNKIMFHEFDVNLIYYRERKMAKGKVKETTFA